MASPIQKILQEASFAYMNKAQIVIRLAISYIVEDHMNAEEAVDKSLQESQMDLFWESAVEAAIAKAFAKGAGIAVIPLLPELREAWDPSGMKLSEKLHGTQKEIRQAIISTIQQQQKLGKHAMQAARALYDGYNSGVHVIRKQELPKYMQDIVNFVRRSEFPDDDCYALMRLVRRAQRQTERLGSHGAPNRALRAAYKRLLQAIEDNNTKAIENAVKTAVEEKSRYVAERIARTEAARAWADGFHSKYDGDTEVVAYRWQLSSRHPHYDICDMYAHANLWGLGPGIFPKDKTPTLPVHPHCLCHLSLVYVTELDGKKEKDNIKAGGDRYLKQQSHSKRCQLMGIAGTRAWEKEKADWRQYMRNWSNDTVSGRFHVLPNYNEAVIPDGKIFKYALNPDHPKGKYKAIAFQKALGYNLSNGNELIENVRRHLPIVLAVPNGKSSYGNKYFADMVLVGPNGKSAKVRTCWQIDNGESTPRLTSIYVKD